MSHKIACFAPDAPRLELLERTVSALGFEKAEDAAQAELSLIWGKTSAKKGIDPAKSIFLGENTLQTGCYSALELPFRAGALIDAMRRFFKSGPAFNVPAEIPLGSAVFKPRDSLFCAENSQKPQNLTEKERDILLALYKAGGAGLERRALLERVWAYVQGVETHTLETHIYRLRQKIEDDPAAPSLLVNHGGQYKLSCF